MNIDGIIEEEVILHEEQNRKLRIKLFDSKIYCRENLGMIVNIAKEVISELI